MSLRYDAAAFCGRHKSSHQPYKRDSGIFLFALSDNLISEDWFFAEGERFLMFFVSAPQYLSTEPLTTHLKHAEGMSLRYKTPIIN